MTLYEFASDTHEKGAGYLKANWANNPVYPINRGEDDSEGLKVSNYSITYDVLANSHTVVFPKQVGSRVYGIYKVLKGETFDSSDLSSRISVIYDPYEEGENAVLRIDDYDEYDDLYDQELEGRKNKLHQKGGKKGKGKGHQSVHNKKYDMQQEFDESFDEYVFNLDKLFPQKTQTNQNKKENYTKIESDKIFTQNNTQQTQENKREIVYGVNSHEVKGNMIDFDRVDNIEKVENTYNGRQTFGIKFLFTGKKGLYKTIWFNQNVRERDSVFNKEFGFWKNLKNNK